MAEQNQNTVQLNVLGNIYNNIRKGLSLGKDLIMLQGSARCFAAGTKVRMYDGTLKNVEDIRLGDKVMNMQGDGYNLVVNLHSGTDMLYRVHQPRGIDYIVNSLHELSLKQTEAFKRRINGEKVSIEYDSDYILDIPVNEYIGKSANFKRKYAGFKNTLLQFPKQELLIDPYYLGYWLGNGTSARPHDISTIDAEIINWFAEFAKSLGVGVTQVKCNYRMQICEEGTHNKRKQGAILDFCNAFRYYDLYNNKHVPNCYIYGDYEDRLKLLAGLIDADGSDTRRNTISITQKNKQIADAIVELCRTTGFYTNGACKKIAKMKREDGSVYECDVYVIEINHNNFNDINKYIKVPRKRIQKDCKRNYFTTRISLTEEGVGEFYGFTLTGDHHFLLEDGTVVKNSGKTYNTLIYIILECLQNPIRETKIKDPVTGRNMIKKDPLRVSIVRQSLPVIKRSVYEDFKTIMISMGQWEDRRMNKTDYIYTFPNGATIEFFSADDEQKLRGPWRHILYINEANEIYYYSFSMLRQRTYEYVIVDYNPSFTEEHWLFPLMKDERSYHFISTYRDNIFLPAPAVREIESYQTTNPALWQIFGKGEFAIVEGLVFPKENWDIIEDDAFPEWLGEEYIGIDWGFTNDPTVFVGVIIYGDDIYVRLLHYQMGMKTKDIADALAPYAGNYKYCDIDNRLVTELEDAGIPLLTMTKKNSESIMSGIRLMNQRKIHITVSSTELIKEMRNYVYKKDRHDAYQTNLKPIDKFNHCIDALRYVVYAECGGINADDYDSKPLSKFELGLFM